MYKGCMQCSLSSHLIMISSCDRSDIVEKIYMSRERF